MKSWELIKELAVEALDDETTKNRWRWVAVLNLSNDKERFGAEVTEEGIAWAKRRIEELDVIAKTEKLQKVLEQELFGLPIKETAEDLFWVMDKMKEP